jgi:hypothetical protein
MCRDDKQALNVCDFVTAAGWCVKGNIARRDERTEMCAGAASVLNKGDFRVDVAAGAPGAERAESFEPKPHTHTRDI